MSNYGIEGDRANAPTMQVAQRDITKKLLSGYAAANFGIAGSTMFPYNYNKAIGGIIAEAWAEYQCNKGYVRPFAKDIGDLIIKYLH